MIAKGLIDFYLYMVVIKKRKTHPAAPLGNM